MLYLPLLALYSSAVPFQSSLVYLPHPQCHSKASRFSEPPSVTYQGQLQCCSSSFPNETSDIELVYALLCYSVNKLNAQHVVEPWEGRGVGGG